MAKPKNHVMTNNDQATLVRLAEEYAMLGRYVKLEQGKLTVFALPPQKHSKKS